MATRFASMLKCASDSCGEIVVCSGDMDLDEEVDEFGENLIWVEYYSPKSFVPNLRPIQFLESYPNNILAELDRSFDAFWSNPSSAANRLRCAVEELLDSKKVRKTATKKNGGRRNLQLHERIDQLSETEPEAAKLLGALKILGNRGSHADRKIVDRHTLLDGYEVFEHVLESLFERKHVRMKKLAGGIARGSKRTK